MIQLAIKGAREAQKKKKAAVARTVRMSTDRYRRFEEDDGLIRPSEINDILSDLGLEIGPIKAISLDQTILNKIKELNELIG